MAKKLTKKKLTVQQEFEIMKLVLDKFLILGVAIIGFGMWQLFTGTDVEAFYTIGTGAAVLILFMIVIVKEYEIIK